MNNPDASQPLAREKLIIWLLCGAAAARVFIFSAAFPFFNTVDEIPHFDLVVKYSQGHAPRGLEHFSDEARPYLAFYGTLEYFMPPDQAPGGKYPPPPWLLPPGTTPPYLQANLAANRTLLNAESGQPPLYYVLVGAWWRLGHRLRLDDGWLLYSLRFLNIFFISAVVWVAYLAARTVFPDRALIRLGVPALAAFIPQSVFYSIQNDIPSPIFFGIAFICLARWLRGDTLTMKMSWILGLSLAAAFLTKASNLPLLAVATVAVMFQLGRMARANALRPALPAVAALLLSGGVPALGLLCWNKFAHGDFAGSAAKIRYLTWTLKPFGDWWSHPIFRPHGLWTFLSGNIATFWQGENVWHGHVLASPVINDIYTILTLGLLGSALGGLLSPSKTAAGIPRRVLWLAFGCVAASVLFVAFLSIIYDFHDCFYPSPDFPYFVSGRLMLGALIPFLILFVFGLDFALGWIRAPWARPVALITLIPFMLITEIITNWPVFFSQYNWYHM